jgi:hypothetical protein
MRYFYLILLTLLIACQPTTAEPTPIIEEPSSLQVMIASDDYYVGTPRIALVLFDGIAPAEGLQNVTVRLFDLRGETPAAIWEGAATEYADAPVAYWTTYPEIPAVGEWGLQIDATMADGSADRYDRLITVAAAPRSPAIGVVPPASLNRTIATNNLSELSSGRDPVSALYQMTVADALQSGKPSVITFATPAFCQTQVCAPVVNTVEAVYEQVGDAANFLHLEVYKDFQELTISDEMTEWNLTTEPWTFVLNAAGEVTARLGGPVSKAEILAELTNAGVRSEQ